MFDALIRPYIDPPLNRAGRAIARAGVTADQMTVVGAMFGLLAGTVIAQGWYILGLVLIALSRAADGLDGAVARAGRPTDFGGYLDIVSDFIFYTAVPVGFGLSSPENLPWALVLVACFTVTGISFLAFAIMAAKRGLDTDAHGKKSFFYNTGIAEGTETIAVFLAMCLWPAAFPAIAGVYSLICILTVVQRTLIAADTFA